MDEREDLIAGAVDSSLDAGRWAALADLVEHDPASRVELAHHTAMAGWLRSLAPRSGTADAVMRALPLHGHVATAVMRRIRGDHRVPRRSRRWLGAGAALAAAVLLAIVAGQLGRASPDALRVSGRSGDVAGDLDSAFVLEAGATLSVAAGDGAAFVVAGPASLRIERQGGAGGVRFALDHGRMDVVAPPRPTERPLEVSTPLALLEVVGTRFTVEARAEATMLWVSEGRVRLRPTTGGGERMVAAGEQASVPAAERTLVVSAAEDATADAARPGESFGRDAGLRVRARAPARIACIRFRLPPGAVRRATLLLTRSGGEGEATVARAAGPWDEATLRWWHAPERGARLGMLAPGGDGRERVDVTAACVDGVCDLVLVAVGDADCVFASREAGEAGPRLELVLAPAP